MHEISQRIAQRLRELSRDDRAKIPGAVGVTAPTIWRWAHGQIPGADRIPALAAALQCDAVWLLSGQQDRAMSVLDGELMRLIAGLSAAQREALRQFLQSMAGNG